MSTLSSAISILLLWTSVFNVEGKQYFDKDEEYSKRQWTNIGICTLKFPHENNQFDKCMRDQQYSFESPDPAESIYLHPNEMEMLKIQFATRFIQELELTDQFSDRIHSDFLVTYSPSPEPSLYVTLKRQEHGDYKYVNGRMRLPFPKHEYRYDNVMYVGTIIERDDWLVIMLNTSEQLKLEQVLDMSFTTSSPTHSLYSVRIVIAYF